MKFTAYDFASTVDRRLESLSNEQYHKRERPAKRLIEEVYPISRLALAFKQPGLAVHVEANENSGRADGHIWISGYLTKDFEVEVTFAGFGEKEALRSALLHEQGFAPGLGSSIRERSLKKAAKKYVPGTVLLIAFEDMRLRGKGWWELLYKAIDEAGGIESGEFSQVYLFNACSNELQQV